MLETLVLSPKGADASILFLHGLGASAEDILPVALMLQQADYGSAKLRFVLPSAAQMPVTMNNKAMMPSWYDIIQLDPPQVDCDGVQRVLRQLDELVQQEIAMGIDARRIILIGYSQGGSVTLAYAMEMNQQVGGVVGLSCFLPPCSRQLSSANLTSPFLLMHGIADDVVPFLYVKATIDELEKKGYQHELKTHPYGHLIDEKHVKYLSEWIKTILKC